MTKKAIQVLLAAVLLASWARASRGEKIDARELMDILSKKESVTLIDVRTPEEFEAGHIPGSVLLPLSELEGIKRLPYRGQIVIYCRSGRRSSKALEILAQKGITGVMELEGGIRAWMKAGGRVVAGPYKQKTEYPKTFEIPRGVCEPLPPSMIIGK